jgi:hypothetical protein
VLKRDSKAFVLGGNGVLGGVWGRFLSSFERFLTEVRAGWGGALLKVSGSCKWRARCEDNGSYGSDASYGSYAGAEAEAGPGWGCGTLMGFVSDISDESDSSDKSDGNREWTRMDAKGFWRREIEGDRALDLLSVQLRSGQVYELRFTIWERRRQWFGEVAPAGRYGMGARQEKCCKWVGIFLTKGIFVC